ncbi:hypothetical protein I9018_13440 [Pseudomonas sp. MPFS]|uniref:hypothetical protein n=1 Tax=Pseudomonas sp. MPFS TaxID=2795724 RepID=UPI001F137DCB|nr:hypothetical protein [Pseudomonas sp. MPFS]UMZ14630.1 hypothetical protein I9018_13440 [Pseudomonas sp. MPFS]
MTALSWTQVSEQAGEPLEFGAAHVRCAWRRHVNHSHKFASLEHAFTGADSLPKLLQNVDGNRNARNHRDRGAALFAAVWYRSGPWAILCDATHATLVPRTAVEALAVCGQRDDHFTEALRALFAAAPAELLRVLDDSFYRLNITRPTA